MTAEVSVEVSVKSLTLILLKIPDNSLAPQQFKLMQYDLLYITSHDTFWFFQISVVKIGEEVVLLSLALFVVSQWLNSVH